MLPIVMLVLSVIAIAVLATVVFMVVNVLREGPSRRPEEEARWQWRPPLGSRAELVEWAAKVAETVTQKLVAQRRNKATPTQLAEEVLGGATFAINNVPILGPESQQAHCEHRDFCRMGVTAPEVLAIADRLRADEEQSKRIQEVAAHNARVLAGESPPPMEDLALVCPLIGPAGDCTAHQLRPLFCRANVPLEATGLPDDRAKEMKDVVRELGEGVEAGLSRGLEAAGLDGHIYELNSALATALATPDASERWARGENVFAKCARYESPKQSG